jgi:spore germination protein KA
MKRKLTHVDNMPSIEEDLLDGSLTLTKLKDYFSGLSDLYFVEIQHDEPILSFYCEGMIDHTQYNDYYHGVMKVIKGQDTGTSDQDAMPPIIHIESLSILVEKVFSGFLLFYKEGDSHFCGVNIAKIPQRTPEESTTEVSIKGPKDSFTEELNVNISLIRKRLKTEHLYNESFTIGLETQTKVSLLYLNNKVNQEMIKEVRSRLETFQTEGIVSSGQLEQWLSDRSFTLFPLFDYITRPDFVVECMLRGRFIIIVNGSPSVLIGPINLFELIKSPEDVHYPYFYVAFQRLIRLTALMIAMFLPGFWIAISSVNIDQLPFPLLATVVIAREGLPFPYALEAIFILGLFELLKEAGVRMPKALGQTISIVGGLIIGDAAIRAGLASPALIVVIALSAVATYTLVNQSLTGTVSILRIYCLVISAFLGVYGFFIAVFSVLIYLCHLESFKLSYLEPISSLNFKEYLSALLVDPFKRRKFTAPMLEKRRR